MKKIYFVYIFVFVISLIINLVPKGLDAELFGFLPTIFIFFLLPFLGGILLILTQDKNKSYEFLPFLLIGTCINVLAIVLPNLFIEYFRHGNSPALSESFVIFGIFLPLAALSLFGGLIGLLIRGTTLVIKKLKII